MDSLITFQDFEQAPDKVNFIKEAISAHKSGFVCQEARMADRYDRQLNDTIHNYAKTIFTLTGDPVVDFTASNNRIASNFFHRLNTQRNMYCLGNGVTFAGGSDGVDETKEKLGKRFDHDIQEAGLKALEHGVTFVFWNVDRIHVFPVTEFVPIWDEDDGTLRAGIRFWRLSKDKPMSCVLYEEDGYTKYREDEADGPLKVVNPKRSYREITSTMPDGGEEAVIGEENYGTLPVIPFWGSKRKQSTLVGMREAIDSYDLIRSGFANDLTDVSQIYWIVENAGGMEDADLERLRDRLKLLHMASVDTEEGKVTPYTQEIPYQARKQYLDDIRAGIYEDFGGLDVHTIAAGATNDHIDAAYQPMDEEAADFEFQVSECIQGILDLIGIEDSPVFKRQRISNQKEQVEMVTMEAQWLDEQTVISKFPNISPDEVAEIMERKENEDAERMPVALKQWEDNQKEGDEEEGEQE